MVTASQHSDERWQLYRLLADPNRLRLLALASAEELSVGELAELLEEPQPNVSRHAAPLRQAGLLSDRKDGTRIFVHVADGVQADPVVADALGAGRRLCAEDGSLDRVAAVVARRDAKAREFFAQPGTAEVSVSPNLPVYLHAFAGLLSPAELAVDAGTGDGELLDILAPLFQRVVALDRSSAQLERARARLRARGYRNVELVEGDVSSADECLEADLVVAARMLHHAPRPRSALAELARLAKPGGKVLVIDYARHEDQRLSEELADLWLGFSEAELAEFARGAGLVEVSARVIPAELVRVGPDAHLGWIFVVGTRPEGATTATRDSRTTARKNGKQRS
ncbi:MAG: metalloregulator ArsR/SmtB family transcription factor [Polyangiaceae bacterium]